MSRKFNRYLKDLERSYQEAVERSYRESVERFKFPAIPICPYPQFMGKKRTLACYDCSETSCRKMHEIGLGKQGAPLPPSKRPRCGAKTRAGGSCRWPVVAGKRRCRFHGGASTGPKTAAGRTQVAEAQRKRWSRDPG